MSQNEKLVTTVRDTIISRNSPLLSLTIKYKLNWKHWHNQYYRNFQKQARIFIHMCIYLVPFFDFIFIFVVWAPSNWITSRSNQIRFHFTRIEHSDWFRFRRFSQTKPEMIFYWRLLLCYFYIWNSYKVYHFRMNELRVRWNWDEGVSPLHAPPLSEAPSPFIIYFDLRILSSLK